MPFNGSGTFTSLGSPQFPAVANTYIYASYFNANLNDIFQGLSSCLPRDGQSGMIAALPMGGFKIENMAAGVAPGDAVNVLQAFTSPTLTTPTMSSPTMTGVPTAPTASPGTNTTQVATTEFVLTQAMNVELPLQTGNEGKFLTTNGATASWSPVSQAASNLYLYANFGGF